MAIAKTNPAQQPVTLPTVPLAVTACVASGLVGVLWAVAAWSFGRGAAGAIVGLLAAAVVAVSAVAALLLIRPWKARPLHRWPVVWMTGSGLRMAITLAVTYLLYSAPTPYGTAGLWLAVVAAYFAALVGETRAYALFMKRFAPPATGAEPSE